jgi:hypothetical protein
MEGHGIAAIGRPRPLRRFAGDRDLVIAVARLVADHGAGASLTREAVAHGIARGFAFNGELKLATAAGGVVCHCAAPWSKAESSGYGSGARSRIALGSRARALLKEFDARGGDRKSKKGGRPPFEKSQRQAAVLMVV